MKNWALDWLSRHPGVIDRIDRLVESSEGYDSTATMIIMILPLCYLLVIAAIIPAFIIGHQWWLISSAVAVVAAFYTFVTVCYYFLERRRKKHGLSG